MKNLVAFLVAAVLGLTAAPAFAQAPPYPAAPGVLAGSVGLSATATTGRVALPSTVVPYGAITVSNYGTKDAYVAFGSVTVVATTSSTPVRAGKSITVWLLSGTYIAGICGGSDSTTLDIYQATGFIGASQ